jgi:hypothetical protein
MNEYLQIVVNVAPAVLFIAACVAGALWAEDKHTIRDLEDRIADLEEQAARGYTRADELTKRRHDRIRQALADGTIVVPSQPRADER